MGMKGKRSRSRAKPPAGSKVVQSGARKPGESNALVSVRKAIKLRSDTLRVTGVARPSVMIRVHVNFANLVRGMAKETGLSITELTGMMADDKA